MIQAVGFKYQPATPTSREFGGILDEASRALSKLRGEDFAKEEMPACFGFTISNEAIAARDVDNPAPGPEEAPKPVMLLYGRDAQPALIGRKVLITIP